MLMIIPFSISSLLEELCLEGSLLPEFVLLAAQYVVPF